jgi:predicted membrane-bound spermidine synthase
LSQQWLLIAMFTLSGFSGIICESIWAQYLKLLLGYAAYAQTLVLAIFMGGMAISAWWLGKRTVRLRYLLLGYAVVEGIIGLAGFAFHPIFGNASSFAAAEIFPALESPDQIAWVKWAFAALLIAPQSTSLGMTFPLMSGPFFQRVPNSQGRGIEALCLSNSLGAAVGVLASRFILLSASGLPGTVPRAYAVGSAMLGELARGQSATALRVWEELRHDPQNVRGHLDIRLLHGYALANGKTSQ